MTDTEIYAAGYQAALALALARCHAYESPGADDARAEIEEMQRRGVEHPPTP